MPDRKKEVGLGQLEGEETGTSSSDAFVARTVDSLGNEVVGLNGRVIQPDDGDVLKPRSLAGTQVIGKALPDESVDADIPSDLKPDQSHLGFAIWRGRRAQQAKRAA